MHRVFILSPANSGGERARLIFNPKAGFELAQRLQRGESAALAEIFSFLSGLYFRGKHVYSNAFARPPGQVHGAYVITSNRGLLPVETEITLEELRQFGEVPIDPEERRYADPLMEGAERLAKAAGDRCEVVLLGSISTRKYAEPLMDVFGGRLLFPPSFVGRGDMSRGGLLLRCVAEKKELEYAPISGAVRHGKRPERLSARSWGYKVNEGKTPVPGRVGRKRVIRG